MDTRAVVVPLARGTASATSSSSPGRLTRRGSRSGCEIAPGRVLEAHVHDGEDDAFHIVEGEMTFVIGEDEVAAPPGTFVLVLPDVEHGFQRRRRAGADVLNIHAPAGFDRRIGLPD